MTKYTVFASIWIYDEKFLGVNFKMCKRAEYSPKFKKLGYCWILSVSFLSWWKNKKREKNSHIEMWLKCSSKSYCTRPVFSGPHSSCQLASKWVFFLPCSRSSSCSPSLPFKPIPIFPFSSNNDSLSHRHRSPGLLQPAYDSTCF